MLWPWRPFSARRDLDGTCHDKLAESIAASTPLKAPKACPLSRPTPLGRISRVPRLRQLGILLFAAELDPAVASRWYAAYEQGFWKDTGWIAGFTETPATRTTPSWTLIRPGLLRFRLGGVRFGIGAPRRRPFRPRAPLTTEAVACCGRPFWPADSGLMGRWANS